MHKVRGGGERERVRGETREGGRQKTRERAGGQKRE